MMKHSYEVGGTVTLVSERPHTWSSDMDEFLGQDVVITYIDSDEML